MSNMSISIIVPALNEERNLEPTIKEIMHAFEKHVKKFEILIYDDNSIDNTGIIADKLAQRYSNIRVFHNNTRKNIGGVYSRGIEDAELDYIILIPGDNEAIPEQIVRGLTYLDKVDLIVFYHKNEYIRSFKRRFISKAYVKFVNLVFNTNFTYTSDTNIYKRSLLMEFKINAKDFSYQTEALIKAIRLGTNFIEIGNDIRNRKYGKTKLKFFKSACGILRNIMRLWVDINVLNRNFYNKKGKKIVLV